VCLWPCEHRPAVCLPIVPGLPELQGRLITLDKSGNRARATLARMIKVHGIRGQVETNRRRLNSLNSVCVWRMGVWRGWVGGGKGACVCVYVCVTNKFVGMSANWQSFLIMQISLFLSLLFYLIVLLLPIKLMYPILTEC
jgi:hypothetical protein